MHLGVASVEAIKQVPGTIKIWTPSDDEEPADTRRVPLSPNMTLQEFFEVWFVPIVLAGRNRDDDTLVSYRESIAWWVKFTHDPPLCQIDEYTIATFQGELPKATYKRGATGPDRLLAKYTVCKHLKQIRAVLYRTGPTTDPKREAKELLSKAPCISVAMPKRSKPKPVFDLADAPAMLAAAAHERMRLPKIRGLKYSPMKFWRGLVLTLFYTGLRIGTVKQLEFSMIQRRRDGYWLEVPGEIVDKTEKPLEKFLHPCAVDAIDALRTDRQLIFPWPHNARHLATCHDRLQEIAGMTGKRLSPHAWRRTHGREMGKLGAFHGLKVAQRTLDHEDDRTTSSFYCDLEAELIAKLPYLAPKRVEKQTLLF